MIKKSFKPLLKYIVLFLNTYLSAFFVNETTRIVEIHKIMSETKPYLT